MAAEVKIVIEGAGSADPAPTTQTVRVPAGGRTGASGTSAERPRRQPAGQSLAEPPADSPPDEPGAPQQPAPQRRAPNATRRYQAQNRLRRIRRARAAKDTAAKDAARQQAAAEKRQKLAEKQAAREESRRARKVAREEAKKERAEEQGKKEEGEKSAAGAAAGGAVGGALGRRAGMAIGTAVGGPIGTAIGGMLGGIVGNRIGTKIGGGGGGGGGGGESDGGGSGLPGVGEVAEQTQKALKLVGNAARFTGEAFEKVAKGDAIGLVAQGAEAAAGALDEIPVVGKVAGEALRTFATVLTVTNRVVGAFADRARELQGYDGRIAGATARQDVTRLMSDIRESQQLGGRYERLLEAQTQFEETLKAGLLPLKEWALEVLPKVLETILDVLLGMLRGIDAMVPGTTMLTRIATSAEEMRRVMAAGGPASGDIFSAWLSAPVVGPRFPGTPAAPAAPLGVPLIAPLAPPGL